jgi:hypothetical protein
MNALQGHVMTEDPQQSNSNEISHLRHSDLVNKWLIISYNQKMLKCNLTKSLVYVKIKCQNLK